MTRSSSSTVKAGRATLLNTSTSQAKASENTGYRVPKVGEIVEIDGRVGIVYERVEGETMLSTFIKQPYRLIRFSHQLADLHLEMHAKEASGIKTLKSPVGGKDRSRLKC